MTKTKTKMEIFLDEFLNDYSLEEIFEMLNVDVYDAFEATFETGLIDEELIDGFIYEDIEDVDV